MTSIASEIPDQAKCSARIAGIPAVDIMITCLMCQAAFESQHAALCTCVASVAQLSSKRADGQHKFHGSMLAGRSELAIWHAQAQCWY